MILQEKCQCCDNPSPGLHDCPYRYEMDSGADYKPDDEEYCNCCDECMHQCAMDI
jgi:hypothetical protein